ncbi:MAG: winged helix-turn-helix domain-containing tetratricopeptide repeat protein [Steroidobacter sp.]
MSLLRFSMFELDSSGSELRRNGRRVHLQEMPLRVLEMLLERPNELVPREAFFARLWPHDETGILDDNLNTAVRKLRLALNDSAHHPRFIETIPKRGYRFVGPLVREDAAVHEPSADPSIEASLEAPTPALDTDPGVVTAPDLMTPPSGAAPSAKRRPRTLIAATFLLAIVALGVLLLRDDGDLIHSEPGTTFTPSLTLAVLPFTNASGRPEDEYFSDGLTEEIMDRLSRSGDLRVVSRTSAFALKGKDLGARDIGQMLGAESLVEGSIRRDGERLRISARLVNARDGYQRWSQTYDGRLDDVIAVQEEIARAIADTLTGKLIGERRDESREGRVASPLAYDHYLKGRFYWHRRTRESLRAAATHFEEAVRHAPEYAPAWAGLADAYAVLGFYDFLAPTEAFPKAQAAARRALELDPRNASAEATMGYAALYYEWNLAKAEGRFRRSIDLDPSYTKAHQWYGNLLTAAGRFEEAERAMRRAQQLEPLSMIASAALGWSLYHAGRHEDALEQYRLTLALDPDFELAYLWSGWALEALGRYDEALTMLEDAAKRSGGSGISLASLARVHALRGEREAAERILTQLMKSNEYVPAYEISKAWFALGASRQAAEWLQRAFEQRSHSLVFLRVDPQMIRHQQEPAIQLAAARVRG